MNDTQSTEQVVTAIRRRLDRCLDDETASRQAALEDVSNLLQPLERRLGLLRNNRRPDSRPDSRSDNRSGPTRWAQHRPPRGFSRS